MDIEDRPTRCPYGHPLAIGLVELGWQPCQCRSALAHRHGHTTYTCRVCSDGGWTMIYFEPGHLRSAAEKAADVEAVALALAGLEQADADPEEVAGYRHVLACRELMTTAGRS